jgi:hypothetical protein
VVTGARKALLLAQNDGTPARASPFAAALSHVGFEMSGSGMLRRRRADGTTVKEIATV